MSTGTDARSRRELEEERDSLLASLEALEREREEGDIDPADYKALRDDYTVRAAAVLRALDEAGGGGRPETVDQPEVVDEAETATPRQPRRAAGVVAVVIALALLAGTAGALLSGSAEERRPGDPATGDIAATGPSQDVAAELEQARRLMGEGRTLDAIKAYDQVLDKDPGQAEALAYRGWLVRLAGRQSGNAELVDKGLEYLNRAVAADPAYPDAHFFRGLVLYQDKADAAGAVPELRAFLAADPPPEMVGLVQDVLRRAEADVRARPAP